MAQWPSGSSHAQAANAVVPGLAQPGFRQMPATGSIPAAFRFPLPARSLWILPCATSSKHHGPIKMAPPRNLKADLRARDAWRGRH